MESTAREQSVNRHTHRSAMSVSARGATLLECALVFSLVVLVSLGSITVLGGDAGDEGKDSSSRIVSVNP